MSLKSVSESFIPATEALDHSACAKEPLVVVEEKAELKPPKRVNLEDPNTLAELSRWNEIIESRAETALSGIRSNIYHTAHDDGLTSTSYVNVYDRLNVHGPDIDQFIVATADLVTRAVVDVLRSRRYRVQESSTLVRDINEPSSSAVRLYRVELAIDWSEPLPPEEDGELAADTANW